MQNSGNPIDIRPYDELFIYYLKGRPKLDDRKLPSNFIGNWQEDDDSILFFSSAADRQIEKLLGHQPGLELVDRYQMSYENWLGEKFVTSEHGSFCIGPPWEVSGDRATTASDGLRIILDPGLVFGTGTHPTTRDCLEALEMAAGAMPPSSVLDLGTGTGLLALAAARLGFRRVVGVDLNLLAAQTARRNVQLNRLADQVLITQGRAEEMIAFPTDLLIANIHHDVMRRLIGTSGFLAKKRFILSGLMRGEAKHITERLQTLPVKILKQWTPDGIWHTIYGMMIQNSS